jgi:hypothetical protein
LDGSLHSPVETFQPQAALTQERLAWRPTGPGLITDLEQIRYQETETDVASTSPARATR